MRQNVVTKYVKDSGSYQVGKEVTKYEGNFTGWNSGYNITWDEVKEKNYG